MLGLAERMPWALGMAMVATALVGTTACSRAEGTRQGDTLETAAASSRAAPEILVYKSPT